MNQDFLDWYNAKYPESNWDIEDQCMYDSWYEYFGRDEHQQMLYDAWCAGIGNQVLVEHRNANPGLYQQQAERFKRHEN